MRKLLLLLTSFCLAFSAIGQDRVITGKVTSSADALPMPGVNVVVKGTTNGTVTDQDGGYRISVGSGSTLVFSFVGMVSQEVAIGDKSIIDIAMNNDETQLNEIVVVGYSSVPKKELTGAVSSVSGEAIQNLPVQSFDKALQGRAAGVQVLSANGVPGGAVSVRIRGVGSVLAGNEPLYIVDGVQLNTRNDGASRVSTNPLAFLNPNDIESIDILKDAANASIYGAQAANGVVIVTTKKGKAGQKTKFDFNYSHGVVDPMPSLRMLNTQELFQIRKEATLTSNPTFTEQQARDATLTSYGFPTTLTDTDISALPTYDWQGAAFKSGSSDNMDLSMSGGNDVTTFYTSMSYSKQDASLINIDFEKIGGKVGITHKISSRLTADLGLNLSNIKQRGPYGDARSTTSFGAPQYGSYLILPFNPIYDDATGQFYGLPASGKTLIGDLQQNVIASSNFAKSTGRINQIVSNLSLNYDIAKGLSFRAFGGLDYRDLHSEFFGDPRLNDYFSTQGTFASNNNRNFNFSTNYTLNYAKTFGSHSVSGLIGAEYRSETNTGDNFTGTGFPTPDFSTANAAATPTGIGSFWTGFKRLGFFGNVKYDLSKKYFASITMRYDGSSRFGSGNQFGFFPSFSGAWAITEEGFLKGVDFISELKLRGSWGTTGNDQIGDFASRSLYGVDPLTNQLGNTVYNGVTGIRPMQLGNPNLHWERNETTNIGLDYGVFNNRISGSVEVFRRLSKDLLLNQSLVLTSGYATITKNVGEVKNEGLEVEIKTINFDRGGFTWQTNFNITFLRNEVMKLYDGLQVLPGDQSVRVGYPLGTLVTNPYAGVNPANGRPMHYDINGNITYLRATGDLRPIGLQDFSNKYGGFTNTFTYKGIELTAFFMYDYGRTVGNVQHFRMADNGGALRNSNYIFYEDRWTTPGQITSVPRPALNRTENSARISSYQTLSRFFEDASFIRLKQVTLSYNIPQTWLSKVKLSYAKVYAQGMNLFTWTKWTGVDPEFRNTQPQGNTPSVEGIIPQVKNYTVGVQIGF